MGGVVFSIFRYPLVRIIWPSSVRGNVAIWYQIYTVGTRIYSTYNDSWISNKIQNESQGAIPFGIHIQGLLASQICDIYVYTFINTVSVTWKNPKKIYHLMFWTFQLIQKWWKMFYVRVVLDFKKWFHTWVKSQDPDFPLFVFFACGSLPIVWIIEDTVVPRALSEIKKRQLKATLFVNTTTNTVIYCCWILDTIVDYMG